VKEWLKSVLNYQSYPKNKTGYPFFWNTLYLTGMAFHMHTVANRANALDKVSRYSQDNTEERADIKSILAA